MMFKAKFPIDIGETITSKEMVIYERHAKYAKIGFKKKKASSKKFVANSFVMEDDIEESKLKKAMEEANEDDNPFMDIDEETQVVNKEKAITCR